jgi:hypothetical protein
MLGVRGCAAEIEAPSGIGRQDHRAFEGGGAEGLATYLADRLEVDSVPRLSDNDAHSTARVERSPKAVREPEDAVHQNAARTTCPVAGPLIRRSHHDLSALVTRKINN